MLLDPETLDLTPRARELAERTKGDGRFKLEMPAAQFEIASPALRNAAAAADFLRDARRDLARHADGIASLACAGVHPFGDVEGDLNAGERYKRVAAEYGRFARRQLVFGLQVHVAVRPAAKALAVYNGMRSYLPHLLALAANSPFYRGQDTGLAAIRPKLCELLPRQGVPPALDSWDDYAQALAWGARAGGVADPGVWWWELRPHVALRHARGSRARRSGDRGGRGGGRGHRPLAGALGWPTVSRSDRRRPGGSRRTAGRHSATASTARSPTS